MVYLVYASSMNTPLLFHIVTLSVMLIAGTSACQRGTSDIEAENPKPVDKKPQVKVKQHPKRPSTYKKIPDLVYGRVGETPLLLDLYLPKKKPSRPMPVIVWIHGGGWWSTTKAFTLAPRLTSQGYAVASVEYRLSQVAKYPAQIHDCKAAVRWLRANAKKYGFDPERFGAWGTSAGAHLAALLGTTDKSDGLEGPHGNLEYSSRVQAVCDYYAPTDFTRLTENGSIAPFQKLHSMMEALVGGPLDEHPDLVKSANPITFISPDDPPFLIIHGGDDDIVPLYQSKLLFDALVDAQVEATLHVQPGAKHSFKYFRNRPIERMVDLFFNTHLKNKPKEKQ
jgi:acetyl esterase/lipase